MNALQRNAGTAGVVAAVFLLLLVVILISVGQAPTDPAKALQFYAQNTWRNTAGAVFGVLATAFGMLFVAGLASRLRDSAPTRATALLYFGVAGLTAYAVASTIHWPGLQTLSTYPDQTAATHAYLAYNAIDVGIDAVGAAFTGASLLIAGWATVATGAISRPAGYLAAIAGIVGIVSAFSPVTSPVALVYFVLYVAWLVWGGLELRREPAMATSRA